jgi:hypothetical protein
MAKTVPFFDFSPVQESFMTTSLPSGTPAIRCEVTPTATGYAATGTFHFQFPLDATLNELDQIERCVEHAGQQIKRHLCQTTLETADVRCAELLQKMQPHLHKNGKKSSRL